MRIIAGEYKGRPIKAPQGDLTRPTTDRVREALMSALISARGGLEGTIILDAFAGSGALGLEAFSRGAAHVTFFEKDSAALRILRANIAVLNIESSAYVLKSTDILKHPPLYFQTPFDIVFLDPPYAIEPTKISHLLDVIIEQGLFTQETLVSYEHSKASDSAVIACFGSKKWESVASKHYGDTTLDIFRHKR